MKNKILITLLILFALVLGACSSSAVQAGTTSTAAQVVATAADETPSAGLSLEGTDGVIQTVSANFDSSDLDASETSPEMSTIALNGGSISFEGAGVVVDGSTVTITNAGMYNISGTLNDGQLIVDSADEETVVLVLNGVNISSSVSAPIYVRNADKTVITLANGTQNIITDSNAYLLEDAESDEPNAAVFSKDDLTINGSGTLTVNASYQNGIVSKDDLKISGGTLNVTAVNDGIKGKNSLAILDGSITVNAGGDGLQASNETEADKGYVVIEGGVFTINAGLDGIRAETQLSISNGNFAIVSGGGSATVTFAVGQGGMKNMGNANAQQNTTDSAKGLKAGTALMITGGIFNIDSADDTLHANTSLIVDGAELTLASGDDGIHADNSVTINGGTINITKSYEGIEATHITINDGTIHLVSADDGLNATNGTTTSAIGQGGGMEADDGSTLVVNGGYIVMDTEGDGFDTNGSGYFTGGTLIINGTVSGGNGPVDVNGVFEISGGLLVAVGSANMPDVPSNSSTQNTIALILDSAQQGGTMLHIESESGGEVLSFTPTKTYQFVVVSSPNIQTGATYNIYTGGSSSSSAVDGLYQGGTYSAGSLVSSLAITSRVNGTVNFNQGFPGGGKPDHGNPPGKP